MTSATGEQLGIMPTREALHMAEEQHLDLVEVAPKAQKSSGKNKKKQQQEKPATQGGNTHAEN